MASAAERAGRRVVVVGAGITGLAAAYHLASRAPELELEVLEASPVLGGHIVTERVDGFLVDGGPDSFVRTKPDATELVEELGLGDELITTRSRRVYVVHHGRLELLPGGMALAVPTRLGPMLETPLLTSWGKARALGDLLLGAGAGRPPGPEESIGSFLRRRFGPEVAERIAGPLLGGIYAGDIEELGIEATFPQLVAVEAVHGSMIRGLFVAQAKRADAERPRGLGALWRWLRRADEVAPSPFYSLRGGMGALCAALAARLPAGAVQCSNPVVRVAPAGGHRWEVHTAVGAARTADAVVLALPAPAAARCLAPGPLARELSSIRYASTATVFFGFERAAVAHPLDGVGFIVPRGEAKILAGTWVSSKWEQRAPDDRVLLRAFLGGARSEVDVARASDDELAALALTELDRFLGLGHPVLTRVFRYVEANPQPVVGHLARLRRIAAALASTPGLFVAGAGYDGVGIPDCVRQGRVAATQAIAHARAAPG